MPPSTRPSNRQRRFSGFDAPTSDDDLTSSRQHPSGLAATEAYDDEYEEEHDQLDQSPPLPKRRAASRRIKYEEEGDSDEYQGGAFGDEEDDDDEAAPVEEDDDDDEFDPRAPQDESGASVKPSTSKMRLKVDTASRDANSNQYRTPFATSSQVKTHQSYGTPSRPQFAPPLPGGGGKGKQDPPSSLNYPTTTPAGQPISTIFPPRGDPSKEKPWGCPHGGCGKSFARKSDLVRHERIHTNERPYICDMDDCGKSFIQRSALTVHQRVHTGDRPHVCETCQRAFSDSSSLARHRRVHTGRRPYRCEVLGCGKTFCRKTTLTKHLARQHPNGALSVSTPLAGTRIRRAPRTLSTAHSAFAPSPYSGGSISPHDVHTAAPSPPLGYHPYPAHHRGNGSWAPPRATYESDVQQTPEHAQPPPFARSYSMPSVPVVRGQLYVDQYGQTYQLVPELDDSGYVSASAIPVTAQNHHHEQYEEQYEAVPAVGSSLSWQYQSVADAVQRPATAHTDPTGRSPSPQDGPLSAPPTAAPQYYHQTRATYGVESVEQHDPHSVLHTPVEDPYSRSTTATYSIQPEELELEGSYVPSSAYASPVSYGPPQGHFAAQSSHSQQATGTTSSYYRASSLSQQIPHHLACHSHSQSHSHTAATHASPVASPSGMNATLAAHAPGAGESPLLPHHQHPTYSPAMRRSSFSGSPSKTFYTTTTTTSTSARYSPLTTSLRYSPSTAHAVASSSSSSGNGSGAGYYASPPLSHLAPPTTSAAAGEHAVPFSSLTAPAHLGRRFSHLVSPADQVMAAHEDEAAAVAEMDDDLTSPVVVGGADETPRSYAAVGISGLGIEGAGPMEGSLRDVHGERGGWARGGEAVEA